MENKDRIKALNILFTATWISIIITMVLSILIMFLFGNNNIGLAIALIGPITTYIVGRILCFKEYKDETP